MTWLNERRSEGVRILVVALQLALLVLLFRQFGIQDSAFRYVAALVLPCFVIHAFLPLRLRMPFFLAVSVASVFLVLGASAAWVLTVGLVLVGICYLPVSFATRVGLILVIAAVLAAMRATWIPEPWSKAIWPVLTAMFMFRLIIYLYDTRHEKERPSLVQSLSYFFMVPNVCFPLFPVVDFKRFQRSHYSDDAVATYQRGVSWIFRGVIHLVLYRVVYQYFAIDPATANGLSDVLQFSFLGVLPVPAGVWLVPFDRGDPAALRLQLARDAQQIPAGFEFQRPVASDQHLLEGLHDEDLLLPDVLSSPQAR